MRIAAPKVLSPRFAITYVTVSNYQTNPQAIRSGQTAQATVTIDASAPQGGTLLTLGAEPAGVVTLPATITVPAGQTQTSFNVVAGTVTSAQNVNLCAQSVPSQVRCTRLGVRPNVSLASLSVHSPIPAGVQTTGTVHLNSPAPVTGGEIVLSSSDANLATPVTSLNRGVLGVSSGESSVSFTITTKPVLLPKTITLTANASRDIKTAQLLLEPPHVLSFVIAPEVVKGGESSQGTITLNRAAPAGAVVHLTSGNPALVAVPASVPFKEGDLEVKFPIQTRSPLANEKVQISATVFGTTKQATIAVTRAMGR